MAEETSWEDEMLAVIDEQYKDQLEAISDPASRELYRQRLLMQADLEGVVAGGIFNTPGLKNLQGRVVRGDVVPVEVFDLPPTPPALEPAAPPEPSEQTQDLAALRALHAEIESVQARRAPPPEPSPDPTLSRGYLVFVSFLVVLCVAGIITALSGPVPSTAWVPAAVGLLFLWQVIRNVRARRRS